MTALDRRQLLSGIVLTTLAPFSLDVRAQDQIVWTNARQLAYANFARAFVADYKSKIDCADLATLTLVRFAAASLLPIRLFDYSGRAKRWIEFVPGQTDPERFARFAMQELGAVNLIENSVPVPLSELRAGDLIMTERSAPDSTGHTRIVTKTSYDEAARDWRINWYQGTLPPAVPEPREFLFGNMPNPHNLSMLPRRWNFAQFSMAMEALDNRVRPRTPWRVVTRELGHFVLAREFSDGTRLEMEMDGGRHVAEAVSATNTGWNLRNTQKFEVRFDPVLLDWPAGTEITGSISTAGSGGTIAASTPVNERALSQLFANAHHVKFLSDGKILADISLEGSATAMRQLEAIMAEDWEKYRREESQKPPQDGSPFGAPDVLPDVKVPYPN